MASFQVHCLLCLLQTKRRDKHLGQQEAPKSFPSISTSKEDKDLATHGNVIGHAGHGLQQDSCLDVVPANNFKCAARHASSHSRGQPWHFGQQQKEKG